MNRQFTGVFIPAHIWTSKELIPAEKMLLGEIDALSKMRGYCDASRSHFAEWLGVTPQGITYYFEKLERLGFISVEKAPGQRNKIRLISERFYIEQGVSPTDGGGKSHLPEIKDKIQEEIKEQNTTVAPSSLLVKTFELVEVNVDTKADEKSAVEENPEPKSVEGFVRARASSVEQTAPQPEAQTAKPKRKGKNEPEEYTYADIAKHLEIPCQVFFRDIIQNLAWPEWVEYKKVQFRFQYKAALYASKAIQELFRMSQGKADIAKKIVDQSIGRAWQGFVQLPIEQPQRQPYQQQQPNRQRSEVDGLIFSR